LDSWFKSGEVLKIGQSLGMLLATTTAAKSVQICPKLFKTAKICPKTISLRNFEMPPKIEILVFLKIKKFYV
jgi:hypothetical protein